MTDRRQLIAIGGVSQTSSPPLFDYLFEQAAASAGRDPRIGFLPTASADADARVARFYELLEGHPCRPSHFGVFGRVADPAAWVGEQDAVIVSGGNTRSMLALWREWGLDTLLRGAWQEGVLLAGWSAGAICWFDDALCDARADRLDPVAGLGLLSGSACPHFDGEPERRPTYTGLVASGAMAPGIAIDDGCALHVRGTVPTSLAVAAPGACAYAVSPDPGSESGAAVVPLDLPTRSLVPRGCHPSV